MKFYSRLYYTIIYKNVNNKILWESKTEDLHRHHIIPKHSGGEDTESNYTYLTIREHIAAHWLLWKMHGDPNDLRAMNMLGANLTRAQRKIVGEFCRDNGIGMFNERYDLVRNDWRKKGARAQMENQIGIHDPANFKKHASLGGKASIVSDKNPWKYWASAEGRSERASLGGKSHKGKKCMYRPGDKTFKRVSSEDWDTYLELGYIFGSPIKNVGVKKGTPSPRRKPVSYKGIKYESMAAACKATGLNYHQLRAALAEH